ncbi:MAG TPA: 3-isopropylmalate dehydratase large subunit [Dongiaceae bacterium]|jgi:3-isopropylmalate/(R)-2-methylmalate dehydratase large subunit|nr:3-isopropylmalate dehydratase large subunit [Dongiaceae bacterium]
MSAGNPERAQSMFDKIWSRHSVATRSDGQVLVYVDHLLIHDGYAPAFDVLRERGLRVRHPERSTAVPDHYIPTTSRDLGSIADPEKRAMVMSMKRDVEEHGIQLFPLGDPRQGIVHVVGPEQGITQPGIVLVCADSHTSTHGALGALAFGVGMTEAAQILACQAIWQRRPKSMRIWIDGQRGPGVTAKDIILAVIGRIGASGAIGHVIEYAGPAIAALSVEGRLTVCNMSIEAGARAGLVAPDDTTFAYLKDRPFAPSGAAWDAAVAQWRALPSDPGAAFDREVRIDISGLAPMVTWGTSPQDVAPVDGVVPDPDTMTDPAQRERARGALGYMGLVPGMAMGEISIDRVFIGSCTNSRIEDLRGAAVVVAGRKVHPKVEAWVVPGSTQVKLQAEAEGLDRTFKDAGFAWHEAGCSLCLGTNGDLVPPGQRCASTSNRNFVGRQGPGARTHLMSPMSAAAAAIEGRLADVRTMMERR